MTISVLRNLKDYETKKESELAAQIEESENELADKVDRLKEEVQEFENEQKQKYNLALNEAEKDAEKESRAITKSYENKIREIKQKGSANKTEAVNLILKELISNV
ncbi:hypothetical protein K9M79_05300 [Candidatus Woesearchaeota archaeon]|nr:hypothetical protein [Candidatus Woesearchaeota archaeon]